jgi:hypothetical protein
MKILFFLLLLSINFVVAAHWVAKGTEANRKKKTSSIKVPTGSASSNPVTFKETAKNDSIVSKKARFNSSLEGLEVALQAPATTSSSATSVAHELLFKQESNTEQESNADFTNYACVEEEDGSYTIAADAPYRIFVRADENSYLSAFNDSGIDRQFWVFKEDPFSGKDIDASNKIVLSKAELDKIKKSALDLDEKKTFRETFHRFDSLGGLFGVWKLTDLTPKK